MPTTFRCCVRRSAVALAPRGFGTNVVQTGWAFWYAPWSIPAALGSAMFVSLVFPTEGSCRHHRHPAVRVVFGFK